MRRLLLLSALFSIASILSACQTSPIAKSKTQARIPDVQLPIFIGKTPTSSDLQSYRWKLSNVYSKDYNAPFFGILRSQIDLNKVNLDFSQNQMRYSVGCNTLSQQFNLSDDKLQMIGRSNTTEIDCGDIQSAEIWLSQKMQQPSQLAIMEMPTYAIMQQITADGSDLTWEGALIPEVKYGKGETIYLEVKPKWQYCDKVTDRKCLQVREVNYNDVGVQSKMSNWKLLDSPIMGYRHDENTQRILRLTRYRTTPTTTKGYGNLYALESIVKSTNVNQ